MWATLHAFEHNNLGGMTLIPAPKYGQTLLRSMGAKTSISDHLDFTITVSSLEETCRATFHRYGLGEKLAGGDGVRWRRGFGLRLRPAQGQAAARAEHAGGGCPSFVTIL